MPLRLVKSSPSPEPLSSPGVDPLRALATAAAEGDEEAVRTLAAAVWPAMLRAVRSVLGNDSEVEDALQEAAIGLVKALPEFRGEGTVLHFACRIAVLQAITVRRRRSASGRQDDEELSAELPSSRPSPAEEVSAARRREIMRELCNVLPEGYGEALMLHSVLGFTVEEVARAAQAPIDTIRSRLRRAKATLRDRIRGDRTLMDELEVER